MEVPAYVYMSQPCIFQVSEIRGAVYLRLHIDPFFFNWLCHFSCVVQFQQLNYMLHGQLDRNCMIPLCVYVVIVCV